MRLFICMLHLCDANTVAIANEYVHEHVAPAMFIIETIQFGGNINLQ